MQKYTSANTSLNQIPCVHKYIKYEEVEVLLDYGCGKYTKFKDFIEGKGIKYYGYDPFHKTAEENLEALMCEPDLIVCCNVLNVIDSDKEVHHVLKEVSKFDVPVIFTVYEGDGTGIGRETRKDCYQRNMKTKDYIPIISKYFNNVKRSANVIFCKNP